MQEVVGHAELVCIQMTDNDVEEKFLSVCCRRNHHHGVFNLRIRYGLTIQLAAGIAWQFFQLHDDGRHHVVRQLFGHK